MNDTEIAESLWLMPQRATSDIAVGNDDDVVHPSELLPADIKFRAISTVEDDEVSNFRVNKDTVNLIKENFAQFYATFWRSLTIFCVHSIFFFLYHSS